MCTQPKAAFQHTWAQRNEVQKGGRDLHVALFHCLTLHAVDAFCLRSLEADMAADSWVLQTSHRTEPQGTRPFLRSTKNISGLGERIPVTPTSETGPRREQHAWKVQCSKDRLHPHVTKLNCHSEIITGTRASGSRREVRVPTHGPSMSATNSRSHESTGADLETASPVCEHVLSSINMECCVHPLSRTHDSCCESFIHLLFALSCFLANENTLSRGFVLIFAVKG